MSLFYFVSPPTSDIKFQNFNFWPKIKHFDSIATNETLFIGNLLQRRIDIIVFTAVRKDSLRRKAGRVVP